MWLTYNGGLLADYLVEVPEIVRKLLLYRFICASLWNIWMEYVLLAVFLFCIMCDPREPLKCLLEVVLCTFFSVSTCFSMLPLFIGIGMYGVLICRMHNIRPKCHHTQFDCWKDEFLDKLYLICTILCVTCYSSWFYGYYVLVNRHGNGERVHSWNSVSISYFIAYGAFCGIIYFVNNFTGRKHNGIHVPVGHIETNISLRMICWCSLGKALKETLISTTVFCLSISPPIDILANSGLLYHTVCLGITIFLKLHTVRTVYDLTLQRQLPLIVNFYSNFDKISLHRLLRKHMETWLRGILMAPIQDREELDDSINMEIPIHVALDCGALYGFQMQAAKEFRAAIDNPTWYSNDFELNGLKSAAFWSQLNGVIIGKLNDFRARLAMCLRPTPCPCSERQNTVELSAPQRIRSIKQPSPRLLKFHCWQYEQIVKGPHQCCYSHLQKERLTPRFDLRILRRRLLDCLHQHWIYIELSALRDNFFYEKKTLAAINYELLSGEPLTYILQGAVTICVRSFKEGLIVDDVWPILEGMLDVEQQLATVVQRRSQKDNDQLCSVHESLSWTTSRCVYQMLYTFQEHLEDIVQNYDLLRKLRERINKN